MECPSGSELWPTGVRGIHYIVLGPVKAPLFPNPKKRNKTSVAWAGFRKSVIKTLAAAAGFRKSLIKTPVARLNFNKSLSR